MNADRNSAPIIDHSDTIVGIDDHLNRVTPTRQCFVNTVIDNLPNQMMQDLGWKYFRYTYPVFYEQEQALLTLESVFHHIFLYFEPSLNHLLP